MSENVESAADHERRKASTEPGTPGEGGQYSDGDYGDAGLVVDADESKYTEGDYGDAGLVAAEADKAPDGAYSDGDYGEAGAVGTAREVEEDEERNS